MPDDDLNNHPVVRRLMEEIASLKIGLARAEAKQADYRSPFQRLLLVKRTGTSGKQWKEQTVVNGQVAEFVDGRQCQDDANPAALIPPAGVDAVIEFVDVDAHRYVPLVNWFRVNLQEDGTGANGTKTTQATYRYTARDPATSTIIATSLTPLMPPRTNGTRVPASLGWAYYDTNGALGLALADEKPGTGGC